MKMGILLAIAAAAAVLLGVLAFLGGMGGDSADDIQTAALMSTLMDNGSPILGDVDAPITLVEFGDYQCHFCNVFFHNTKDRLTADYVDTGKVRIIFKDFTIIGPDSIKAAEGSRCATEQGLYWEYHDTVYSYWNGENNGWASLDNLHRFAAEAGLDVPAWSECVQSGRHAEAVSASSRDARSLELGGTPSFFVISPDGSVIHVHGAQPYDQFARIFDDILDDVS